MGKQRERDEGGGGGGREKEKERASERARARKRERAMDPRQQKTFQAPFSRIRSWHDDFSLRPSSSASGRRDLTVTLAYDGILASNRRKLVFI